MFRRRFWDGGLTAYASACGYKEDCQNHCLQGFKLSEKGMPQAMVLEKNVFRIRHLLLVITFAPQ